MSDPVPPNLALMSMPADAGAAMDAAAKGVTLGDPVADDPSSVVPSSARERGLAAVATPLDRGLFSPCDPEHAVAFAGAGGGGIGGPASERVGCAVVGGVDPGACRAV